MKHFLDVNGNDVKLVLGNEQPFTNKPDHVLVLTRHKSQWVLTDHQERGFEFPGGKIERDETVEDAAMREVREETGGIVKKTRLSWSISSNRFRKNVLEDHLFFYSR